MCMHYYKQIDSTCIPIPAYHIMNVNYKHGQACMIMPEASEAGAGGLKPLHFQKFRKLTPRFCLLIM